MNQLSRRCISTGRRNVSYSRIALTESKLFDAPARPSPVHSRPTPIQRDLPNVKPRLGRAAALGVLLISVWGGFVLFATNEEKLSSSVVRQILAAASSSPNLSDVLGHNIVLEPAWYMFGTPHIAGQLNLLQGNVDVKFRIHGSKGSGTAYFSSIRRAKGEKFEILRFKVIADNGKIIDLIHESNVH